MKDTLETNLPEEAGKLEETKKPVETPEIDATAAVEANDTEEADAAIAAGKLTKEEILAKLTELVETAGETVSYTHLRLSPSEKSQYYAHMEARRYQKSVIETGWIEGHAEGRAEGIAEGRAEGIAEGRAESIAKGREEGIAEGQNLEKRQIAANLKKQGPVSYTHLDVYKRQLL